MPLPFTDVRLVCSAPSMCVGRRTLLRFTTDVVAELQSKFAALLAQFTGVVLNIAVNDLPMPMLEDLLTDNDTALLVFNSVGRRKHVNTLRPRFQGHPLLHVHIFPTVSFHVMPPL